jgi:WD40 repeat protein
VLDIRLAATVGQVLGKTDAHSSAVVSVAFSPDGTKIVSGSADMTIKVWDVGALRALKVWDMDTGAPRALNPPLRGRN